MDIKQIIEKFKSDAAFAEKYSALKGIDSILEQAKADGFDVTAEDIQTVIRQLNKQYGELSEADLSIVSGGLKEEECCYEPTTPQETKDIDGITYWLCDSRFRCGWYYPPCKCTGSVKNRCIDGYHRGDRKCIY